MDSTLTTYAFTRQPVRFWFYRIFLVFAVMTLLNACATEPSLPLSPDLAQQPGYENQAPYNKPYKIKGQTYYPLTSATGYREQGLASWYGAESGNRTATGSRFNPKALTAAHKTLPIPCKVRVTNLHNGRHIDVLVNDRGPFVADRLIDLSHGAAKQLGMRGMAKVEVEYLDN